MSFLLDTVAASEFAKDRPNAGLTQWLLSVDETDLYLSVATLAEIRLGVEIMPSGKRKAGLERWLTNELPARFEGRIFGTSAEIAEEWGRVAARRRARGRSDGLMDALIAATANVQGMTVVTRNVGDFEGVSHRLFNPWT